MRAGFSWDAWLGGLFIAVILGSFLDFMAAGAAFAKHVAAVGVLVCVIPGILVALLSRRANQNGFGQVMLVGGCLVALIGGGCGMWVFSSR